MPITCAIPVRNLTREEFDERDAVVMRCSYASQNALGRLCDERVYENDLALRLRAVGCANVHTQVLVTLTHDGFRKEYRLDLLADDALYELKTVAALATQHDTQALHYAMLTEVSHAKLLNFRTARVQGRLRFNALTLKDRRAVVFDDAGWQALTPNCETLKAGVRSLLSDWGAYLECAAYTEALVHQCGGEAAVMRRVPIVREGVELGSHAVACHAEEGFFVLTAFTEERTAQHGHLQRLLNLTKLEVLQWINLNHATVEFVTLQRESRRMGANE